jgi:hypothetical protein
MNPEEQLDRLIEMHSQGEVQHPESGDDISARLMVADTLLQLQQMEVPPQLAARVESHVRAHIHRPPQQNDKLLVRHNFWSFRARRTWIALLGAAALLILLCVGTLSASARSLPGDPLYGLRQAEYQLTLTFANDPYARVDDTINELRSTVTNLSAVVNDGRNQDTILQALQIVVTQTNDSRVAVASLPAGPHREEVQRHLDSALAAEEQTLRVLLLHVNWPVRLALTHQLGVLGDAVPRVIQVHINSQSDGTRLLTVTGANFASHAELVINGQPVGKVSQSASTQLIAIISASDWPHDTYTLGILNPDGTAAQVTLNRNDDAPGDDHGGPGTPGPTSTPTSGDDHGRHGGSGGGH